MRAAPGHVLKNDRPSYVILSEDQYEELVDVYDEAHVARVRASLADAKEGRIRRVTAEQLVAEITDPDGEQSARDWAATIDTPILLGYFDMLSAPDLAAVDDALRHQLAL